MSPVNGHAQKDRMPASGPQIAMLAPGVLPVPPEQVKELVAALEVPFDPWQIEWRVMNTAKNQKPMRGQSDSLRSGRRFVELYCELDWRQRP